jgi:hypothetical protein
MERINEGTNRECEQERKRRDNGPLTKYRVTVVRHRD